MDTESRAEHSSFTSNTVLLTPKSEVADCDVEVKDKGSTNWPEESGLLGHVIMGQPVVEFDWDVYNVYICGHEAYEAVTKCIPDCSIMKSGIANSHIFAGSRCHFVVELHQNGYSLPQRSSVSEKRQKNHMVRSTALTQCSVSVSNFVAKVSISQCLLLVPPTTIVVRSTKGCY